jgi:hypothetical protein
MDKLDVQKRIIQNKNGLPLPLESFEWDAEKMILTSSEPGLHIDFKGLTFDSVEYVTFRLSEEVQFIELDDGVEARLEAVELDN